MRILFLADVNSSHTQKWVIALAKQDFEIGIFSLSEVEKNWFSTYQNITVFNLSGNQKSTFNNSLWFKLSYLKKIFYLKKICAQFKPDIVHAHYASSYGLLGMLLNFHPFYISAWGSDVMEFPAKNILTKKLLVAILKSADKIFSTSKTIYNSIYEVAEIKSEIIPFGIDTEAFNPSLYPSHTSTEIVIGTIKSLEQIYRIDILIEAFSQLVLTHSNSNLKLLIVGGGSKELELKKMVTDKNINHLVTFTNKVEHANIPKYHCLIDIFINVSDNESFGVSVLEASSCKKPVIATNVGGLKDVIKDNSTGFLIEPNNVEMLVNAIEKLMFDKNLQQKMGMNGRAFVLENFDWKNNVNAMINFYKSELKK